MVANLVSEVKTSLVKISSLKDLPSVRTSSDAWEFLMQKWDNSSLEVFESFYCIYLNRSNKILGYAEIGKGGISACVVDVRLILVKALQCLASGIIIAHNHPSQSLKPSTADIQITKKIKEAAQLLDISLLDHLIVTTENRYFSFADECMM